MSDSENWDIDPQKFKELADEIEDEWIKWGKPLFEQMMKNVDLSEEDGRKQ